MRHETAIVGKSPTAALASKGVSELKWDAPILGEGVILGAFSIVYNGVVLGDHVMVADYARVREGSTVGSYSIIGNGVSIEAYCEVGWHVKFQDGAHLTTGSTVGDHAFIGPRVITTNDNSMGRGGCKKIGITIGKAARIGACVIMLPGITIGEDSLVAAGSIVTHDVEPGHLYMGRPARMIRELTEEEKFLDPAEWMAWGM